MRFLSQATKLFVLPVLFVVLAAPSWGTPIHVRGSSGYGPQTTDFTGCGNGTLGPCEVFDLTPIGTATLGGILSFNVFQFAANGSVLDVVDLGSLASGSVFTLSSSLFDSAGAEVFSCGKQFDPLGNPESTGLDSGGLTFPGSSMCTPNLTTAPVDYDPATGKFTVTQTLSGDLVLDFSPAGTTSTPEPTSLALLGVGLVALGSKLRRRTS